MWGERSIAALAAALCVAGIACSGGGGSDGRGRIGGVSLDRAFGSRTFSSPVKLVQHPTNDNRWYVVEQTGQIKTFVDTDTNPATTAATVGDSTTLGSGEQGLLGMAFDPNFATSGEVYVAYTLASDNRLVLARWVSSNNGLTFTADAVILQIPHSNTNHNGSDLAFDDAGSLYYSTGDGGGSDDPDDNGQDRTVLLGKILRLDVSSAPPAGKTYAIPAGNAFPATNPQCNTGPGTASCPEIFAYGFRNPWRMNFDPDTGDLYVGDVGQGRQEEIDLVTSGGNYGWDCLEGELDHLTAAPCSGPFVAPEAVYDDSPVSADAVTGGAVYRGSAIPGLRGFYIFTDFFHGPFLAFDADVANGPVQELSVSEPHISAFGQGRDGEIYPVDHDGQIWKLVPSSG